MRRISDFRHDFEGRRAVAGHRTAAGREGRDRAALEQLGRRRDRGRLRGVLAGRLRRRRGRQPRPSRPRPSPRSLARRSEDIDAAVASLAARRAAACTSSSRRARCTWSASSGSSPTRCSSASPGRSRTPRARATRWSSPPRTRPAPTATFLAEVCRTAVAAGATIVNLPDTVGYASPTEYAEMFTELLERVPRARGRRSSRSTATTTSASPSRTPSPEWARVRRRSSARSTASASARATLARGDRDGAARPR